MSLALPPNLVVDFCAILHPLLCFGTVVCVQVPGMSRAEAGALYQGGVLNSKNLLATPIDKLATALRINVPFRAKRQGCGKGGHREGWLVACASSVILFV